MNDPLRRTLLGSAIVAILCASSLTVHADPGFGLVKKHKVTLQVRRPAAVRLANTSVGFRTAAASAQYQPVLGSLEATLETELVGNERTLVKKSARDADWVIGLTVTAFSVPQPKERVQPIKNQASLTFLRWTGSLKVAYQVVDQGGRVHAAENVAAAYDHEFQTNAPSGGFHIPKAVPFIGSSKSSAETPQSADDVRQVLVEDIVKKIAMSLGNTVQPLDAQVAGGHSALDRSGDFIDQRLYARAIEELEKTPAFAKPADEAYRQYNLGLAYEAMSYESKTYPEQRANLFKAQEYYDRATDLNRDQRYFVEVVARLKDSLARYRALDVMQKDDQRKSPSQNARVTTPPAAGGGVRPAAGKPTQPTSGSPRPTSTIGTGGASTKPLTVRDVIELHAAGVQHQQIVELIQSSPAQFNLLDKDTVLAIARAKLPITLQNEMRKKTGLPPLGNAAGANPPTTKQ